RWTGALPHAWNRSTLLAWASVCESEQREPLAPAQNHDGDDP
ncbi:MAG: hypothetical protein ACI970_001793, partial [Myxococcota bacterium]